jgi:hydrogenase expression/formation protein HypE
MSMGSGGKSTNEFIKKMILDKFNNIYLDNLGDSAFLKVTEHISFSTDSFVVQPEFFNGGDIGKLAVFGTCNDLAVSGSIPKYLSLAFVIPEGYLYENLEKITNSIKDACNEVGVKIVCGDTKVIEKNALNGLIINTSGVGFFKYNLNDFNRVKVGDKVIFTSDIARHGIAVLISRNELNVESDIQSDCGNLFEIFKNIDCEKIHFARDATRGGVAAVLNEISEMTNKGFYLEEEKIPIEDDVLNFCEFFGYDPLTVANEGLAVLIVEKNSAEEVLKVLKNIPISNKSEIVGEVSEENYVVLRTSIGGKRRVESPVGELIPRIC